MGFDDPIAELACRRQYRAQGELTVLCLGRLVPIKGVEVLLRAFQGLAGARMLIAGDGPQRISLENRARDLGVNATFLGFVPPSERRWLLARADIYALPSLELPSGRHEGLPLGLVEAMASGLPVIASQTGGVAEIVKHGETGLLTPPGSCDSLAKELRALVADMPLRAFLGTRAAQRVRHRSWSFLASKYESLLVRGCLEESLLTDAPVNL
jgi:glycosyltransferase involved in cell wall biosynthesis